MECRLFLAVEIISLLLMADVAAQAQEEQYYDWSCSPLDANNSYYTLPGLGYQLDDENVANSSDTFRIAGGIINQMDVYPLPSTLNCSGTVSAVEFCYFRTINLGSIDYGTEYDIFTLTILEQTILNFTIIDMINIQSTPTPGICTDRSFTQFSPQIDIRYCCDRLEVNVTDHFSLPASNFAFAIVSPPEVLGTLQHSLELFPEFRVRQYSIMLQMPTVGDTFVLNNTTNRRTQQTLRLLQFVITPDPVSEQPTFPTEQAPSTEPTTTNEEPTSTEHPTTTQEPTMESPSSATTEQPSPSPKIFTPTISTFTTEDPSTLPVALIVGITAGGSAAIVLFFVLFMAIAIIVCKRNKAVAAASLKNESRGLVLGTNETTGTGLKETKNDLYRNTAFAKPDIKSQEETETLAQESSRQMEDDLYDDIEGTNCQANAAEDVHNDGHVALSSNAAYGVTSQTLAVGVYPNEAYGVTSTMVKDEDAYEIEWLDDTMKISAEQNKAYCINTHVH